MKTNKKMWVALIPAILVITLLVMFLVNRSGKTAEQAIDSWVSENGALLESSLDLKEVAELSEFGAPNIYTNDKGTMQEYVYVSEFGDKYNEAIGLVLFKVVFANNSATVREVGAAFILKDSTPAADQINKIKALHKENKLTSLPFIGITNITSEKARVYTLDEATGQSAIQQDTSEPKSEKEFIFGQ